MAAAPYPQPPALVQFSRPYRAMQEMRYTLTTRRTAFSLMLAVLLMQSVQGEPVDHVEGNSCIH